MFAGFPHFATQLPKKVDAHTHTIHTLWYGTPQIMSGTLLCDWPWIYANCASGNNFVKLRNLQQQKHTNTYKIYTKYIIDLDIELQKGSPFAKFMISSRAWQEIYVTVDREVNREQKEAHKIRFIEAVELFKFSLKHAELFICFYIPSFGKIHLQITHNLQGSTTQKGTGHKNHNKQLGSFGSGRVSDIDNPYQVCGISRCEKYKLCATNEMPKYTMSLCVCVSAYVWLGNWLGAPLEGLYVVGVTHLNPARPPKNRTKIWRCKFCDIETKNH